MGPPAKCSTLGVRHVAVLPRYTAPAIVQFLNTALCLTEGQSVVHRMQWGVTTAAITCHAAVPCVKLRAIALRDVCVLAQDAAELLRHTSRQRLVSLCSCGSQNNFVPFTCPSPV